VTTAQELDVVVAGYLGVDLAPGFPPTMTTRSLAELLRPGRLIEVEDLTISLGGVVANTGLALQRFGQRVRLMATLGEDLLGDIALTILNRHDLATGVGRTRSACTAYGLVLAPAGADRVFLECPGTNADFDSTGIDYDVVASSRLFHFGYPTLMRKLYSDDGVELESLFARARERGVATSMDTTLPDAGGPAGRVDWRSLLRRVLSWVDIFVPSLEEILFMLDPEEYARLGRSVDGDPIDAVSEATCRKLGDEIIDMGVKVLLIKAAHRGAYLRTGEVGPLGETTTLKLPVRNWRNREIWVPPCPVDADRMINASGAGDAAVAGFLVAMLKGEPIENAGRYAMLAGRNNLYGIDAISGLPDWEGMTRQLHDLDQT